MAGQLTGTRVSLILEAKSLQYKPRALTPKNSILPSFLCYRTNKDDLREKNKRGVGSDKEVNIFHSHPSWEQNPAS